MGEVQRCEHSRMKNWVRHNCRNAAKVERDGRHYCGTHDPVARKEKQVVRDAARRQKWADHMESRPRYTEAQYAALEARVRELEARCGELYGEVVQAEAALSVAQKDAGKHVATVYGAWTNHRSIDGNPDNQVVILTMKETNDLHDFLEAIAHGGAGEGEGNG